MKILKSNLILATILAVTGLSFSALRLNSQPVELTANFQPLSINGQSGGNVDSQGCGFIATTPNQIINVKERINYMRLSVQAQAGETTLLVDGPDGRFCVLADQATGVNPEISGVWLPGRYTISIGDKKSGSSHPFTLTISRD